MDTDSEETWFLGIVKMFQVLGKGQWGEGEELVHFQGWGLLSSHRGRDGVDDGRLAGLSWLSLGSGHRCLSLGNSPLVANRGHCSNPRTTVGNSGWGSGGREPLPTHVTS